MCEYQMKIAHDNVDCPQKLGHRRRSHIDIICIRCNILQYGAVNPPNLLSTSCDDDSIASDGGYVTASARALVSISDVKLSSGFRLRALW